MLSQSKCVLNAIPLTPVGPDVNNLDAITPNHFLLGNKNGCRHNYHAQKTSCNVKKPCDKHTLTPPFSPRTNSEKSIYRL